MNDTKTTKIYTLSLHDALPIFIGLDVHDDVSEGRRGREVHDADNGGLLAQAHRGAIPTTTREQLTSRGVADPLDADQLTKPVEVLRRPDDSARCRLNAKIGEQISQRRLHLLRTFRRMSRRLDAHPVHTTRFAPPPLIFSNVPVARRRFFDGLTVMAPGMREDLLAFVSDRGTLLEPDAVEFLLTQDDAVKRLEAFLESCPETPFVVTLGDVMRAGEVGRKAAARVSTVPTPVRNVVETFIPASFRRLGERADDHHPEVRSRRDRQRPRPRDRPSDHSTGPANRQGVPGDTAPRPRCFHVRYPRREPDVPRRQMVEGGHLARGRRRDGRLDPVPGGERGRRGRDRRLSASGRGTHHR